MMSALLNPKYILIQFKLNTIDVAQIFDPKNNVINDFYSRNYMNRLQNARNEEKIKKEKLIPSSK